MLCRLHTQNKRKKWICRLIAEQFAGFSISEQIGYWQGKPEKSLCIEIDSDTPADMYKITRICKAICGYNKQDCVLVQKIKSESVLISGSGIK